VFIGIEGRRVGMGFRWLPVIAVFLVGVSLGLPLFLYLRQAHLDRATA
jgi:Terpene cyclase DEP1